MPLKLYLDHCSQPCRAVSLFLKLNQIDHEDVIVSFIKGDTKKEEFGKITPIKKVPVIDDNGFILTESQAIIHYLASTYKSAEHWYPADRRVRARVDEYLGWQTTNLHRHGSLVFRAVGLVPVMTNTPVDRQQLKALVNDLDLALDQFESFFMRHGDYVAGDVITIADLFAITDMIQPASVGYNCGRGRPKLAAWIERTKARLQPHFDSEHTAIMEYSSPYKGDYFD